MNSAGEGGGDSYFPQGIRATIKQGRFETTKNDYSFNSPSTRLTGLVRVVALERVFIPILHS